MLSPSEINADGAVLLLGAMIQMAVLDSRQDAGARCWLFNGDAEALLQACGLDVFLVDELNRLDAVRTLRRREIFSYAMDQERP